MGTKAEGLSVGAMISSSSVSEVEGEVEWVSIVDCGGCEVVGSSASVSNWKFINYYHHTN